MSFFKNLFFKPEELISSENGYCPNCWGNQEYQNQILKAAKKDNIDLNNIDQKRGWIQAYAAKHLSAIKLQTINGNDACPICSK